MSMVTRSRLAAATGAAVTAALLGTALGQAPTANATCASFFGLGNSAACTSSITSVAIAIGAGAEAHAEGWFGAALAVGDLSEATTVDGAVSVALALGGDNTAEVIGSLSLALQVGTNGSAYAGSSSTDVANLAVSIGTRSGGFARADGVANLAGSLVGDSEVLVDGSGNTGLNVFGTSDIEVVGHFNVGINLFGDNNEIQVTPFFGDGNLSTAFNVGGSNNDVEAGPGPFAISGAILRSNANITKEGPGFNINGVVVGGASAISGKKAKSSTTTGKKSAGATSARSAGRSARQ